MTMLTVRADGALTALSATGAMHFDPGEAEEVWELAHLVTRRCGSPELVANWLASVRPRALAPLLEPALNARGVHTGCACCQHERRDEIDAALARGRSRFTIARDTGKAEPPSSKKGSPAFLDIGSHDSHLSAQCAPLARRGAPQQAPPRGERGWGSAPPGYAWQRL